MEENMYYVVEFPKEEVDGSCPMAIISKNWVFKDEGLDYCWWPNSKTDKAREIALKNHVLIGPENGSMCLILIKYKTDSYEKAQQKLKVLETTSDIESDVEARRKPNHTQKFKEFLISEHSSSSDDLPFVPKKPAISRNTQVEKQSSGFQEDCFIEELSKEVELQVEPTNSHHGKELYEFVKEIYRNQEKYNQEINQRLDFIIGLINNQNIQDQENIFDGSVNFPVNTMQQLKNLEKNLNEESEYKKYLNMLKRIGGSNCADTTRRVLSKLVGNNLALECNWTGRNNKPPFNLNVNIVKLITEAVMSNPLCQASSTVSVIEGTIKAWLRGAGDRDGGRVNRKK